MWFDKSKKSEKISIEDLPQIWKDELNSRIGERISAGRSESELAEFDLITSPTEAQRWFEKYHVDRSKIVKEESQKIIEDYISSGGNLEKIKDIIKQSHDSNVNKEYNYLNICCFGWGPERQTYTMESCPMSPTFNSITNNPTIGDERSFIKIGEINSKSTNLSGKVKVEPGKEYLVYIYYHNNADYNLNKEGKAVATGVKLFAGFSTKLNPGEKGMVCAKIQSADSNPKEVWSSASISSDEPVSISFEKYSAQINNDWKTNGMILVEENLFSSEGVYLGVNSLNGVVFGGSEFHGTVTFKLIVKQLNV